MLSDDQFDSLTQHVKRYVGNPTHVFHELIPRDLHIDIHIVRPKPQRDWYTLVTSGMSELPMKAPREHRDRRFAELMICLPRNWPLSRKALEKDRSSWPLFWMRLLARAPHEHKIWIGAEHTIPNGDPPETLGEGVDFCCWMFREPKTTPTEFTSLESDKRLIRFYGLVPIYRDEMEFALEHGHESLAARLDAANVTELLDIERPSVGARKSGRQTPFRGR
jgi:hypothetical protein